MADAREERGKRLLGNIAIIYAHAFRIGDEVGRKITPGTDAGGMTDRGHHLCDRPFSIRAGNMDGGKAALWTAKACTKFLHTREPQAYAECIQFIEIDKGLLIVHQHTSKFCQIRKTGAHKRGFFLIPRQFLTLCSNDLCRCL